MPSKRRKRLQSGKPETKTERKEPDSLRRWEYRITRARKLREDWEAQYKVKELERFLLNDQTPEGRGTVVNRFLSTAKTIIPALLFQNPKFFTRPKPGREDPADDRHAAIGESVLETIAGQDHNLEKAGRLALWQILTRISVLKIVYDPRMEPNPRAGEPKYETNTVGDPVIDELTGTAKLLIDETGEIVTEPDEIVTDQAYRWTWVDARKMLLPDDGPDMSRWTWIGEEIEVPLEEAKEDPRFKRSLRSQLRPNRRFGAGKDGERPQSYVPGDGPDEETQGFCYVELYDIRKKRMYALADGQNFRDFLIDEELSEGIEDHPYAILPGFTQIVSPEPSPWPLPFTLTWLDPQKEYNLRRTQITEGCKRSARKQYHDDSTFASPDEAAKAMQSSRDMEAIRLQDTSRPPVILTDPPLPSDIFRDVSRLDFDWQVVTGQTGARLADPDAETATEATFIERAANIRDVDMQQQVLVWMATAGRKMFQIVRATLDIDMWIRMRGFSDKEFTDYVERIYGIPMETANMFPGLKDLFKERFGQEKWQRVSRSDLQFEADVEVVPGSTRPPNLDVERSQWLQFLGILGQAPQLLMSPALLQETARRFGGVPQRLLDELAAVAQKMIQVSANQAGRNQGGGTNTAEAGNGGTSLAGLLQSGVLGGQ